ncbi:succinate-semialdehyde dehydrogenase/glutarate-semialdehyde dehydrogenase [Neorhizobium galegae]|uniref:NAD-dependent succinate-semialdehyde dehydrogenase n=1 Tax=Neorhizobium galegae TaxID=399 RepID=UPI00278B7B36|nr:NAD-dependent succinate-semialdehyde dehydrogenase [Neorhizobium galegae]MDQ0138094.1 succinate-semialdehyde dehydrogenase/glutarate-semialdehyde dehydrogenase [Neorhizobium galegae]
MSNDQKAREHYPDVLLCIAGEWRAASSGRTSPILNPATEEAIGQLAYAGVEDLDEALAAAEAAFKTWSRTSVFERYKIMRNAANLLRERAPRISRWMTLEQGKPLAESMAETLAGADLIDWFAEEGRRAYGRIVPARAEAVRQLVLKEPVGPVAAFAPWNFPINQVVRKVSAALASGCSIIVKGPDETPASPAELIRCFIDAGLPAGVVNLVYGSPREIAPYLISHQVIKKITFTGSTPVGKQLAALAGTHMKRATMELGGHAPVMVLKDADISKAANTLAGSKYRNAGQVCVSPTRFLVEEPVFDEFVENFVEAASRIKVGFGLDEGVNMGPLVSARRIDAIENFVQDAVGKGAELALGGERIGNKGYFFKPTVLSRVPQSAEAMNEEPFGPIALMVPMRSVDEMIVEANRLNYGLASYAFTRSAAAAAKLSDNVAAGMLSVNHLGFALPEVPFGGINDSGYGTEGGADALEGYLNTKFVSHLQAD